MSYSSSSQTRLPGVPNNRTPQGVKNPPKNIQQDDEVPEETEQQDQSGNQGGGILGWFRKPKN